METLKDQIVFSSDKEKTDFDRYFDIRGYGVYSDTIRTLKIITKADNVTFFDFSGLIRYDKSLRDTTYKYLAALEEYWRNYFFSRFDAPSTEENKDSSKRIRNIDLHPLCPDEEYGWNLYRRHSLTLGDLEALYKRANLPLPMDDDEERTLEKRVKELRNLVMHHRMMTVDQTEENPTAESIEMYKKTIRTLIQALVHALPENYRVGFFEDLVQCNFDKRMNRKKSEYINFDDIKEGYNGIEVCAQEGNKTIP